MASVPVPVTAEPRDLSTPALPLPGADFLRGAMRLPMARQIVLLVAICASVALGAASVLWMRSADYKQLLDLSDPARSAAVISALEANGIDYRIDDRARMLLVAGDDLYRARMQIAGVSGVSTEPLGYELLDREQTFGQSQMMEAVQYRRGLEGELARNIQSIAVVQQARVLIAQPPQSAFLRNRRKPSASVALTLAPGRLLGEEQIRAITNLVAGAVPELDPEDVSIVDQAGRLLTATVDSPGVNPISRWPDILVTSVSTFNSVSTSTAKVSVPSTRIVFISCGCWPSTVTVKPSGITTLEPGPGTPLSQVLALLQSPVATAVWVMPPETSAIEGMVWCDMPEWDMPLWSIDMSMPISVMGSIRASDPPGTAVVLRDSLWS
ncbi:MAG: flagellar basal-body MS-ring/collar protein FliF [Pseudomonadota bacterium]